MRRFSGFLLAVTLLLIATAVLADCRLDVRAERKQCHADLAQSVADCAYWRALDLDDDPALSAAEEAVCLRDARTDAQACRAELERCVP